MANILGNYGRAREDSYFKREQEADIQVLRGQLVKEGKFNEEYLGTEAFQLISRGGDEVAPMLMEVLQCSARLTVPDAARNRIWQLRRRAGLPPLPEAELLKAIRQLRLGAMAASAGGHLTPAPISLSTRRSLESLQSQARSSAGAAAAGADPRYASRYYMSPEQHEMQKRTFALGLRTAAYGGALGLLGTAAAITAVAHTYGIRSWDDLSAGLKAWGQSWRGPLREMFLPVGRNLRWCLGAPEPETGPWTPNEKPR